MRKTLVYFSILIILCTGVYYFLFYKPENPYGNTEAGFNVKDTGALGKIFIAVNNGGTLLLERNGSGWTGNKEFKVLPSQINLLLTTLAQQQPVFPAPKATYNMVVKGLATDGIKVELYKRNGEKLSVFYVGGEAKRSGTYMLMEGGSTPYVVQVPNFDGYLTTRFSPNIKAWKDRTVFSIAPDQIKEISVQYMDNPINSFVLDQQNGSYIIKADTNITRHMEALNARRAKVYTKYYTQVYSEGFLNGVNNLDSIIKSTRKRAVIDVEGLHGERQHADLYWMPITRNSKNRTVSDADVPDEYDADRMYAVINNNHDTVMVQTLTFNDLLHKSYEFYTKDAPVNNQQGYEQPKNVLLHK